jgi:hypothetical protein
VTAREKYDDMIRSVLGSELKRQGFTPRSEPLRSLGRRRVADHRLPSEPVGQPRRRALHDQSRQCGARTAQAFQLGREEAAPEAAAHLRQRIGELLDGHDQSWDFDAATDAPSLAGEVLAILRRVGLPWLEARSGLERVLQLISGRPEELGWHDLRMLPKLLADAGHVDASEAVVAEAKRRETS